MPPSAALERLRVCRVLDSASNPLSIADAQRYTCYDNHFFHTATWAVTADCNLNCRHCFVAKDQGHAADRFSLEEARALIGEMKACGIREVHLTGGEPLTHPDIDAIIAELTRQELKIARIVTNGLLISAAFLERLRALNQDPLFTISFDGLGTHDWLRNAPGIERKTLEQIDRVRAAGFDVSVQMCLHRGNLGVVRDTIRYFETRGITHIRLIRTSEAPRWAQRYAKRRGPLRLNIWQLLWYYADGDRVRIVPTHNTGACDGRWTVCRDARDNFSTSAQRAMSRSACPCPASCSRRASASETSGGRCFRHCCPTQS